MLGPIVVSCLTRDYGSTAAGRSVHQTDEKYDNQAPIKNLKCIRKPNTLSSHDNAKGVSRYARGADPEFRK